jgi:hypothetical protein
MRRDILTSWIGVAALAMSQLCGAFAAHAQSNEVPLELPADKVGSGPRLI